MNTVKLSAEVRSDTDKKVTKALRAEGKVPATVYGMGSATKSLTVEEKDLRKILKTEQRRNVVIVLDGLKGEKTAMVKDLQVHPITDAILHADFLRVSDKTPVEVNVPMRIVGEAPGVVQQGGSVDRPLRDLRVRVTPDNIPLEFDVSIEGLFVGQSVPAENVELPEGCTLVTPGAISVAVITATRATKLMDDGDAADAAVEDTETEAEAETGDKE